jgi:hypothetical protein
MILEVVLERLGTIGLSFCLGHLRYGWTKDSHFNPLTPSEFRTEFSRRNTATNLIRPPNGLSVSTRVRDFLHYSIGPGELFFRATGLDACSVMNMIHKPCNNN